MLSKVQFLPSSITFNGKKNILGGKPVNDNSAPTKGKTVRRRASKPSLPRLKRVFDTTLNGLTETLIPSIRADLRRYPRALEKANRELLTRLRRVMRRPGG